METVRTSRFLEVSRVGGPATFLVFLLAYLGSAFAAGAHSISIPHRLCDVHGTIEHGTADSVATTAADAHGPIASGPIVRANDVAHHECSLGACARTEAALVPDTLALTSVLDEPRVLVRAPTEARPSVPLLFLAPSRSPPA